MQALTLIAFIGSVFSPYYAWARRRQGEGQAAAQAHCALNVSLYRRAPGARRFARLWAMTERGTEALQQDATRLQIGPSQLTWQSDGRLQIDIDECTVPWPRRLRGRVLLQPGALPGRAFALDAQAHHHWQPISPGAQVTVDFSAPDCHWTGHAYLDANHGSRPLARDFHSWQWQRSSQPDGRTLVLYDVQPLAGPRHTLSLAIDADGRVSPQPLQPPQGLPDTAWQMRRHTRGHRPPELLATLESGPFYCRSLLLDRDSGDHRGIDGGTVAVHESLSLQRFEQPWVQALLPFRMPRRAAWPGAR
ncbi:carotenoid 1,2-hydratase [Roseateles amylovorans]|uniref:Carotenoid 1,2-hydratase n=1 Tax=Roseateles amylovorans TaxID=2978473 RepID=A0ABY6AZI1_9BURK|nr:carotenoid 1,2-hydratase [Roseateles amylovorans]UXH78581.1 carotenoid 1,2-hydratase [Roseateles amylovorans]